MSQYRLTYEEGEDITLDAIPYTCYTLEELEEEFLRGIHDKLDAMEDLTPLQRGAIKSMIGRETDFFERSIKRQITYKFRAEFIHYVRTHPPVEEPVDKIEEDA